MAKLIFALLTAIFIRPFVYVYFLFFRKNWPSKYSYYTQAKQSAGMLLYTYSNEPWCLGIATKYSKIYGYYIELRTDFTSPPNLKDFVTKEGVRVFIVRRCKAKTLS